MSDQSIALRLPESLLKEVLLYAALWETNRSVALRLLIALGKLRVQTRNIRLKPLRGRSLQDAKVVSLRLKENFFADMNEWIESQGLSLYTTLTNLIEEGVAHHRRSLISYPKTVFRAIEESPTIRRIRLVGDVHMSIAELGPQLVTSIYEARAKRVHVWEIREADEIEKALYQERVDAFGFSQSKSSRDLATS